MKWRGTWVSGVVGQGLFEVGRVVWWGEGSLPCVLSNGSAIRVEPSNIVLRQTLPGRVYRSTVVDLTPPGPLNAAGGSSVFGGRVVLHGIDLQDTFGLTSADAGAVTVVGMKDVVVSACRFRRTSSRGYGGALAIHRV